MLRFLKWIVSLVIISTCLAGATLVILFYHYGLDLPDYKQLASYKPPIVSRLYANDGQVFAEYAFEKRIYVPLTAIPPLVKQAFLSAEDKNFYRHHGIDIASIIAATLKNIAQLGSTKRPKGASTITQQVAKNFLLADISSTVSYQRKIKEAILSIRIENAYSKDYIFELYLNAVYLGYGSYGIAASALNYFNKSLDELTISEAAFLATLPKAPSRYNPVTNNGITLGRRNWVLKRMFDDGWITAVQYRQSCNEPIKVSERSTRSSVNAGYFAEEVRRDLIKNFGEKALYQDGYVIRTTLDPKMQVIAEDTLRQGLINYDRAHGWRGPVMHLPEINKTVINGSPLVWQAALAQAKKFQSLKPWHAVVVLDLNKTEAKIGLENGSIGVIKLNDMKWARRYITVMSRGPEITAPRDVLKVGDVIMVEVLDKKPGHYALCQIPMVSGALVVLEPTSGRVLAMQGGFDFNLSQFNRVTQAMRQSGSAFKPFVCLAALESGLKPTTIVYDEPFAVNMGYNLGIYRPHNWDNQFKGPITLRRSFELSRNVATIRLIYEKVGMKKVSQIAKRFNINAHMPLQLSSVLGASETTVLQLTAAYGMVANGGKLIVPRFFDHIQDRYGKTVLVNAHFDCVGCKKNDHTQLPYLNDLRPQIADPILTYQLTSILLGAVQRGTATALKDLPYPVAVKSGTTNDFKDAWMIGYTPDLVVGVFIGFDQPRTLGDKQFGAVAAGPIFKNFMEKALPMRLIHQFDPPAGIAMIPVNGDSGEITTGSDPRVIWEPVKADPNGYGLSFEDSESETYFDQYNNTGSLQPWKITEHQNESDTVSNHDVNGGEPIASDGALDAALEGIY